MITRNRVLLECDNHSAAQKNTRPFMETEGSLICAQETTNGPYPKPLETLHTLTSFLRFILILSPSDLFPLGFLTKILSHICYTSHPSQSP
jgi:hypothetical protein